MDASWLEFESIWIHIKIQLRIWNKHKSGSRWHWTMGVFFLMNSRYHSCVAEKTMDGELEFVGRTAVNFYYIHFWPIDLNQNTQKKNDSEIRKWSRSSFLEFSITVIIVVTVVTCLRQANPNCGNRKIPKRLQNDKFHD